MSKRSKIAPAPRAFIGDGWKIHVLKHWDSDYSDKLAFGRAFCGANGPARGTKKLAADCRRCIRA